MERQTIQLSSPYQRGLIQAFLGDGRPCLSFTGLSLVLSGGFALYLALTRQFLPHDIQYLGMSATELCAVHACRIVDFMIHDRAAFGGALIAIGVLYMWLAEFPLRQGEAWAWWTFGVSGILGFGSFMAYLGYGYLDTWHGLATLLLLPVFVIGLYRSFKIVAQPRNIRSLFIPALPLSIRSPFDRGRTSLLFIALGMIGAGATILLIGMTVVFVPQDLEFMQVQPIALTAINPRLIPLIAHDRAGFGGAILTIGVTALCIIWCARPAPSLWQALGIASAAGFGAAIGVHLVVGYVDFIHLAPAVFAALVFEIAVLICSRTMSIQNSADAARR